MSCLETKNNLYFIEKSGLEVADGLVEFISQCSRVIAWDSVKLAFEYQPGDYSVVVEANPWYFILDEANGRVTLARYVAANYMAAWDMNFNAGEKVAVKVHCTMSRAEICINGKSMSYDSASPVRMTLASIYFAPNTRFNRPQIETHAITETCRDSLCSVGNDVKLEFTVDFYDDLIVTDFDSAKLDGMFKSMAELGAKRAYWIDHGKSDNGFWDYGPLDIQVKNTAKSFKHLGDDFVPPAVKAAHENGMELVGIIKPFDTAILHTTDSFESGNGYGEALGGRLVHTFKFSSEHPELCMKRRNMPEKPNGIGKIEITSRKILPSVQAGDIELWVSNDNSTYQRYTGPANIVSGDKGVTLDALQITEKFVVIKFAPKLAEAVSNVLDCLAKVYDLSGNIIDFTYGLVPRRKYHQTFHLDRKIEMLDFTKHGMNFDNAGTGIPNAVWNCHRVEMELYSPAANMNVLGIAAAVNPVVPGILSESEPKVQQFWMEWIGQLLDAGVDGVEIRVQNHGNVFYWSKYGFNAPIVEEYRKRWGIDITKDKYDTEKLQQLRGEFFTEFLRKASSLVRSRNKKFRIHIEDMHSGPAGEPCPMGINLPWRKWLDENLLDGVTLKALNSKTHLTPFARDVLSACRKKNIPVTYTPFFHSVMQLSSRDWDSMMSMPFDAFNVYEYATVLKAAENGTFEAIDAKDVDKVRQLCLNRKKWDDASLEPADVKTDGLSEYDESLRRWQGIPGVCWAGGDRLLATWYSGGCTEGPESYVVVAKSEDAGKTWSPQIAVIDPPGNVRAFDPTIWRDPQGRMWLFWAQGWSPADEKIWDGRAGVWCSICDNPMADKLVWSTPKRICDGIMLNKPFIARDGRWLLPVSIWNLEPFHPTVEGRRVAGLVTSTDNGATFEFIGGAKILENVFDEHVIFDRQDGTLVLWSRTINGMAESTSSDGGKTWCDAYKNGMDCPNSRFNIARTNSGRLLLVNHHNPRMQEYSDFRGRNAWHGRNNLAAMLSDDDGQTWAAECMIDARQGVSYPDIDIAPDGRIAVIYDYDRFKTGSINVAVFTENDITVNHQHSSVVISKLN